MWPPASGERISKYRVERLLGAGGMGAVYLARDVDLDRDVAIKFISTERAGDEVARRRLIREARAAAGLDHPNICAVHDVVVDPEGRAGIVMQYVAGETLADRLRRGPLETRAALVLASELAGALAAAHKRGIIHRDIKPQNVMITPDGRAKLLDFGIARLDEASREHERLTTETRLTGPGLIAGTPAYMSPEQAQQKTVDGRSDLFSLGAVLFECLTGRLPFEGATPAELYGQILHVHPPPVSALRPGLTERENQLCRRLLAKHPDDRFASAGELLGALRVLVPDTAHASSASDESIAVRHATSPRAVRLLSTYRGYVVIVALAATAAMGVWFWQRPRPLPAPAPEAARWYARGTELMREGAYHSAQLALEEALKISPDYALAYARIAEAHGELDEYDNAQTALLKVDQLIDDRSRLQREDRLRLDAVRALILRDVTSGVKAYTELAATSAGNAGVWLDLGRAQEAAARPTEAVASYDKAIAIDREYAAAHMRRATILGQQRQREAALKGLAEAERLYRAASNVEGETETLLRKGTLLNSLGRTADAREAIERAVALAGGLRSRSQEIRARLRLASITAAQGRFAEAETLAADGVERATQNGLEAVVAEGLTDLGTVFIRTGRNEQADAQLSRAIQLAEKRGAQRTRARAQVQRAYVLLTLDRPEEALALARAGVETMRARHYRQFELTGLAIVARAHEALGQYAEARAIAEELLRVATEENDDRHTAEALESLSGHAAAVGDLPGALQFRERLEQLHRRQQNVAALPYDVTNRAEVLVKLGRRGEAQTLLDEVIKAADAGVESYKARVRWAVYLRGLAAAIDEQFADAAAAARDALKASPGKLDSTTDQAAALLHYAEARLGRPTVGLPPISGPPSAALGRELRYFQGITALARGDASAALAAVAGDLAAPVPSYEFEWRAAAVGAAAARRLKDEGKAEALRARADAALRRLREAWKQDAAKYEARPDLVTLRRDAGLLPRP